MAWRDGVGFGLVAVLVACGPAVDEGSDSAASQADGSAGSDGDSSGAASASGDPTAASETQASGDGGSTGSEPTLGCSVLPDEQGETITVTFRNLAPFPILMGRDAGCEFEPFDLEDPGGMSVRWHRSSCANTCESISKGECIFCGACAGSTFLRLDAGAEYSMEWAQVRLESVSLPGDCEDACEPTCGRTAAVEAGEYTFNSFVHGVCEDEMCQCPEGESACRVTLEEPEFSDTVMMTTAFALPADGVEIVFE